jgi:hypothetical protein
MPVTYGLIFCCIGHNIDRMRRGYHGSLLLVVEKGNRSSTMRQSNLHGLSFLQGAAAFISVRRKDVHFETLKLLHFFLATRC